MFFFWVTEGGIEKDGGGCDYGTKLGRLRKHIKNIETFLSFNNKGARGPQVTKKDARDNVTLAMLRSMPRGARCIEKN
jgi:hypothetical protein